jgi:hypothetical protein
MDLTQNRRLVWDSGGSRFRGKNDILTMTGLLDMAYRSDDKECFGLTFIQRMIGFAVTTLIGMFSTFLSIVAISLLRIRKFSLLFAICNLMILSSTGFLIGFKRQFKSLCEQKQWIASIGMTIASSSH